MFSKPLILKHFSFLTLLAFFASCDQNPLGGHKQNPNGLEYEIIDDQEGTNASIGDFITLHITYKTDKDSVLNSTYKMGGNPISTKLNTPSFKGSFEEGLTMLSAGDSAHFWMASDSIMKGQPDSLRPAFLKSGRKILYCVRMVKIEKPESVEKNQLDAIEAYGKKNNMKLEKTASGLRYQITNQGTDEKPVVGDTVVVHYIGKTMYEGKEFDNSVQRNQPFRFPVGKGMVIPGWDEAFQMFGKGTKATIVIPSKLAYGEMGAPGSPIGPNSPLVFEIELLDIKHPKPETPVSKGGKK